LLALAEGAPGRARWLASAAAALHRFYGPLQATAWHPRLARVLAAVERAAGPLDAVDPGVRPEVLLEEAVAVALEDADRSDRQPPLRAAEPRAGAPVGAAPPPDGLTRREAEVLGLVGSGRTNREIAEALVLSVKTVERHLANVYAKIGARNRAEATAYALRHGLVSRQGP
jgi:DNA-binding NarL/FixJ family response regulator